MAEGRKTLQNVFALDLFDNVQVRLQANPSVLCLRQGAVAAAGAVREVGRSMQDSTACDCLHPCPATPSAQILPRQNEKDPSRVEVDVMVRDKPTQVRASACLTLADWPPDRGCMRGQLLLWTGRGGQARGSGSLLRR